MTGSTLVDIVVLNWNSADLGERAVRSAIAQTFPDVRVVVVDNASTDDSLERIMAAAPDIEVIRSPTNALFAGGMNLGIAATDGAYVLPLNCDAELDPTYVESLVGVLEAQPRLAAVGGLISSERAGTTGPIAITRRMRTKSLPTDVPIICDKVNGACPLFRRVALDEVVRRFGGPYDESYGMYGEDVDLALSLRRLGWQYRFEPSATARHVRSFSSAMRLADRSGPLRVSTLANRHRNISRHGGRRRHLDNAVAVVEDVGFALLRSARGDRRATHDVLRSWQRVARCRRRDAERRNRLP